MLKDFFGYLVVDSVLHLDFVRLSYSHLWVLEEVLKPTMMMMMMIVGGLLIFGKLGYKS